MEIAGIGTLNAENLRFTSRNSAVKPEDFQEILERTRQADEALFEAGVSGGDETSAASASFGNKIDKDDRLYQLCLELETFLVKNIITGMRNTVQKSGLVDEGFAGKMYEDMLYDEYAKDFTKNANFGLAEMAYKQLKGYY